jgi:hypothetical protein
MARRPQRLRDRWVNALFAPKPVLITASVLFVLLYPGAAANLLQRVLAAAIMAFAIWLIWRKLFPKKKRRGH